MSTLSTLRSNLRQEMRVDPNGRIQSDAILNRNLVEAVSNIQQDGNFSWPFNDASYSTSTVIGTATYALPSRFVRLEMGTIKYNGYQLLPADYRWLVATNTSLAVNGNPSYYYLRNNNLGVFQRPNAVQTLEFLYREKLAAMSSDSSDSGMSSDFDEAIVQYAAYLCWQDFAGKEDKKIASYQDYNQSMKGLFDQYLGTRDESNYQFSLETTNNYQTTPFYQ